jgi:peptide chain release factor subunit 1
VVDIMQTDLGGFIRELSEVYDSDSRDSYISLYISKNIDEKFINRRIKACKSILKGDDLKNFIKTMEDVSEVLKNTIWNNIAVFSSHKHNFTKFIPLTVHVDNLLVVDSSPYLRPLARIIDEWESFTLVLISTNYAKIFSVSMGTVDHEKRLSADIMNKHKKGGWSQARFNRLRKGAIQSFYSEVKDALIQIADERIILAGPGQAKIQFKDMLPKNLSDRIIEIVDISIDDEKELLRQSLSLVSNREQQESREAVEHLKEEILKDGLAVYGVKETLDAIKNGQVDLLLIQKDYKLHGWICENCQIVEEGLQKTCPNCGKKTSEVDVLEEILEFAERTNAKIEFTDEEELSKLGYVGAFLRFK